MKSIRIGKDFTIRWSIFRKTENGREEYNLSGKDLVLKLQNDYKIEELQSFSIMGNTIEWVFRGMQQKSLGIYTLILVENQGRNGMMTIDKVAAFRLVGHTYEETGNTTSDVTINDISIDSDSAILPYIGDINIDIDEDLSLESENPIMNKTVTKAINNVITSLDGKVDKVSGKGLSTNDYTTTEKEKLAGLKNYDDTGVKASIANVETAVKGKQDVISDLESIRSGASKGVTALQGIPSEYVTETELTNKGYATASALSSGLSGKVDKVSGKQLSTEDFTTALKNKLQGLSNYDDTGVKASIAGLQQQLNTLTSGNASAAIESFNEIIAFLDGVKDTQDLAGIIASIEQQIAAKANASDIPTKVSQLTNDKGYLTSHQDISGLATKTELTDGLAEKQDIISDLATIRSGASKGATALQSIPSEYVTETELGSKGYAVASDVTTSLNGKVDKVSGKGLSTNDYTTTEKEKLAGIAAGAEVNVQSDWSATSGDAFIKNKPSLAAVATSGSYNDLSNKPTIPAAVTESTISGWGFTKNTGTYSKPSTGIPATDLASSVQTSLGKADTALQSYTETDPVFKASAAAGITSSDITNWNGKTSNVGTITGIKMNGASKGTSGVVDLGTVITAHQDISNLATKTELAGKADFAIVSQTSNTISAAAPNTCYVITSASAGAVKVTAFTAPSGAVAKYTFMFTGATSLTLPSGVLWVDGAVPEIDSSAHYELSVAATKMASGTIYKAVLAAFKSA